MNSLYVKVDKVAKDLFCVSLEYVEKGRKTLVQDYSGTQDKAMQIIAYAVEQAVMDGFEVDWK